MCLSMVCMHVPTYLANLIPRPNKSQFMFDGTKMAFSSTT